MSEEKKNKIINIFKEYVPYVIAIIVVLLIKRYVVSPIKVNGESMASTLKDGDIMILDEIKYRFSDIKRFDIVVVRARGELLIKRVIGLPGETIMYKNNKLFVNGKEVEDKYGKKKTADFSVELSEDGYYVLGDNRTNSLDSRYFGEFSKKDIIGKTSLIVFPFNRMGNKE